MRSIKDTVVVTSILKNENKILILKRSKKSKSYSSYWGGISGFLEENEDLLSRSLIEVNEETLIAKEYLILRKILKDQIVTIPKIGKIIIQPFYFYSKTKNVTLNWEHEEFMWITKEQIPHFELVPKLSEMLIECFKIQ